MGKQQKILVVEDEPRILKTLSLMFQGVGYSTKQAATAQAALHLLTHETFDAVFLDLNLPDMNGIHLIKNIRDVNPHIPVLILTGDSSPETERAANHMGVKAYLVKPVEPDLIIRSIENVLPPAAAFTQAL